MTEQRGRPLPGSWNRGTGPSIRSSRQQARRHETCTLKGPMAWDVYTPCSCYDSQNALQWGL
eukprot:10599518-Prorocentrum_lima.AAC.1